MLNKYASLQDWQARIKKEMIKLHLVFNMPYVIVEEESGEQVEQGFRWTDETAKETFYELQKALNDCIKREQTERHKDLMFNQKSSL